MLEHKSLLLLPWNSAETLSRRADKPREPSPRRRRILDPVTKVEVGFACQRHGGGTWFQRWLPHQQILQVHEIEDESLLFTLHKQPNWFAILMELLLGRRSRSTRWEVRDSEENVVGLVDCQNRHANTSGHEPVEGRDPWGRLLAVVEYPSDTRDATWKIIQPSSPPDLLEMALVFSGGNGLQLDFAASLDGEPFVRMLLLAMILAATD